MSDSTSVWSIAGHLEAMVGVGICLLEGLGVDSDEAEGLKWPVILSDP